MVVSVSLYPFIFMAIMGFVFICVESMEEEKEILSRISLVLLLISVIAFEAATIYVDPIVGLLTLFSFIVSFLLAFYIYSKEETKFPIGIFYFPAGIVCIGTIIEVIEMFTGRLF